MLQSETKNVHVCYSDNVEERELTAVGNNPTNISIYRLADAHVARPLSHKPANAEQPTSPEAPVSEWQFTPRLKSNQFHCTSEIKCLNNSSVLWEEGSPPAAAIIPPETRVMSQVTWLYSRSTAKFHTIRTMRIILIKYLFFFFLMSLGTYTGEIAKQNSKTGVGKQGPGGHMRPAKFFFFFF